MNRFDDSRPVIQPYPAPRTSGAGSRTSQTLDGLAEMFILSFVIGAVVVMVVNIAALAVGRWSPDVLRASFLAALIPLSLIGVMCARMQLTRLVAAFEEATQYDWDGDGEIGVREDIRLIPVRGGSLVDGVDERDLRVFIKTICDTNDWTQGTWRGKPLPSGVTCDNAYHTALVAPLVKAGFIQGRGPRKTGRLIENDADTILRVLGLNPVTELL